MFYLNESHLREIGINWRETLAVIGHTVEKLRDGDYAQPIKPYLRYRNPLNRIIAMPAYVGGDNRWAGLKWIASFPGNIDMGLPRAHSVVLLNEADTGVPKAVIKGSLLSAIRTASVTGFLLDLVRRARSLDRMTLGIIGWGPIGRTHFDMCMDLFGDKVDEVFIYDLRPIEEYTIPSAFKSKVKLATTWQEVYEAADTVMTCTVASARYIDAEPRPGQLLLNVSLRDYQPQALINVRVVVVDNWDEVNRENTDIEQLHKSNGLQAKDVLTLEDVVLLSGEVEDWRKAAFLNPSEPLFFSPMGMAVFDISLAAYYLELAEQRNIGVRLE